MKIRFLYFQDCPSHEQALARLNKVLAGEGLSPEIEIVRVESDHQARDLNFIGSPTILVDGEDIDPEGAGGQSPALACRIYRWPDGRISPMPSEQMIRRALKKS